MTKPPIRLDEVWAFCAANPGPWKQDYHAAFMHGIKDADGLPLMTNGLMKSANVQHIVRHHPQRVLADTSFKQALLDEHEPNLQAAVQDEEVTPMMLCPVDGDDCTFAQGLAALYDTHPDYREVWRP